jgi:hypothetical protein
MDPAKIAESRQSIALSDAHGIPASAQEAAAAVWEGIMRLFIRSFIPFRSFRASAVFLCSHHILFPKACQSAIIPIVFPSPENHLVILHKAFFGLLFHIFIYL